MRRLLPLLALLAAPAGARTTQDGQVWVNLNAQGPISGRLLYYAELQPRFFDGFREIGQVLARGAIGWKLSDRISVYQGYAHIAYPGRANEERPFQQLLWSLGTVAGGRLSSRMRLEERWRSDGPGMQARFRHFVRWAHPLTSDPKGIAGLISVEPFVVLNGTGWGGKAGFDQLRTNVALEIPLTGRTTMEVGYLNQYVDQARGDRAINHVAHIMLVLRP